MNAVQYELNLESKSDEELKFDVMQKQIDSAIASMDKVRKKMFAELGEVKKLLASVQNENKELKLKIEEFSSEKTEWIYAQGDCLFDVREHKEKTG